MSGQDAKSTTTLDARATFQLLTLAGNLNSTPDLDNLLEKIGSAAEKLLDSEASAIMLASEDKKNLYFKVASGEKATILKTMTLPIGQGIGGYVAKTLKPEVVNDTKSDPRFTGQFDKASGFKTKSLLCVPMIFRGELVGVVEVLNKKKGSYTQDEVDLLSSLASLASVAITNAKIITEQKNFFSHVLELLVDVIETTRPTMEGHPVRSAKLACAIGRALGMNEYDYRMLYYAGLLHDIGYIAFKNKRLLDEMGVSSVSEEMHPIFSVKILEGIKMIEGALPIINHHHERFDGTGFPGKLKGDAIPLGARILGLVESMEELHSFGLSQDRLYAKAIQEAQAGTGRLFDPNIVSIFVELLNSGMNVW